MVRFQVSRTCRDNGNTMIDFKSFYSIEQLADHNAKYEAHAALRDEKSPEAKQAVNDWLDSVRACEKTILSFLSAKAAAGELQPIPFVEGRKLRHAEAWNSLVAGTLEADEGDAYIANGIAMFPLTLATGPRKDGVERPLDVQYEEFAALINSGKHIKPSSSYGTCNRTGDTLYMDIADGWNVRFGYLGNGGFAALAEEAPVEVVQHVSVALPSGVLLISDWVEVDGFRDLVNPNQYLSRETDAGCEKYTEHYANTHGFLWAAVDDGGSLAVIRRDDQLLIGRAPYDEATGDDAEVRGENLGHLEYNRISATAIDRATLVSILSKDMDAAAAEAKVAKWASADGVRTVVFPAGTELHFYQAGDRGINRRFQSPSVDMEGLEDVFAVVSASEIEWSPLVAPSRKARP